MIMSFGMFDIIIHFNCVCEKNVMLFYKLDVIIYYYCSEMDKLMTLSMQGDS